MREFSVPAHFSIDDGDSTVDSVYSHAADNPDLVVFKRLSGTSWTDVTAAEFASQVTAVAKGLIAAGVEQGDRVALMCSTRFEWTLIDYSIWSAGGVTVPVYETSSAGQVEWILDDSQAALLILESDTHRTETDAVVSKSGAVRQVLQIDTPDAEQGAVKYLVELGRSIDDEKVHDRIASLKSSDPATLIYTSGTTGRPKGVQLTHANLLAESRGIVETSLGSLLTVGHTTLMFLPMAHVLARAVSIASFEAGATLGHTNDIPNLIPSFGQFKPDFILSVPRVFEKVFNTAKQKAHSDGKGKVFDAAADVAVEWSEALESGGAGLILKAKHLVFDRLVYSKLRTALGGKCQVAISGGAPLGARLGHFFRGIGVTIYEGYGLTETSAAFAVNTIGHQRIGSVGRPVPGNSVRTGDDGEILLEGPVVFAGYWKNDEASAEALEDGWFRTGDLGSIDEDGFITITGRKKELIVTAGGKNVSPAGLEDSLRGNPLISQAMVVGDQKPFIGALITIDTDAFAGWKKSHGKADDASVEDLALDSDLIAEIDGAVGEANKTVSHAEAIKKFRILPVDFTEESGELTPTMKLKRKVVLETFASDIDAIYAKSTSK